MNNQTILNNLKEGDFIAFGFDYNGGEPNEIIVSNITSLGNRNDVLVHFNYGHHSLGEWVKKENIIAVGNPKATNRIKGWGGYFDILQPEHKLLNK